MKGRDNNCTKLGNWSVIHSNLLSPYLGYKLTMFFLMFCDFHLWVFRFSFPHFRVVYFVSLTWTFARFFNFWAGLPPRRIIVIQILCQVGTGLRWRRSSFSVGVSCSNNRKIHVSLAARSPSDRHPSGSLGYLRDTNMETSHALQSKK